MRLAPFVFFCAVFFAAIAIAPICHADPAVLNGSFESPSIGANNIQTGGGTSWTPNNSNVFIISNNFSNFGNTPYGSQYLGFSLTAASDQQTIPGFVTGQQYLLDFFISDLANNANPQLQVTITGAATATQTFSAPQTSSLSFLEEQLPFTATADGSISLSLIDAGSASIAVDNVSVTAVPEPSTIFAMVFLTGTLSISVARRLRSNRHRRGVERG